MARVVSRGFAVDVATSLNPSAVGPVVDPDMTGIAAGPSLLGAPIATLVPSLLRDTDAPKRSPAASPSMSLPA